MGMRYSKKGALRSGRCLRSCVNSTTLTMLFWLAEDIFLIIVELFYFLLLYINPNLPLPTNQGVCP